MKIDVSSLVKALAQLEDALQYCASDLAKNDAKLAMHLRAGAIQAFEYTYELTFKTLKRYLEQTESNPASIDEMSFNEIIRRGYEKGLLQGELTKWREFRRDRGTTSHTYQESKAIIVYENIPAFVAELKYMLNQITTRNCK